MSRIGRRPIIIPDGVTVTLDPEVITVKGPKGELKVKQAHQVSVKVVDNQVQVERSSDLPAVRALHGLVRSLINNNIKGVTEGFKKTLTLVGTGYRVAMKGQGLTLALGFSHPIEVAPTEGVTLTVEGNDTIHISGINKETVGQVAASIRALKPPEPYKGKGIRYHDEVVRRKQGKAAAAAA